jgi:hypothetical protein
MGKRGLGYGSEDHLRSYMARKPPGRNLTVAVAEAKGVPPSSIRWLGFPRAPRGDDREFRGLEFLPREFYREVQREWKEFWPTTGRQPTWDAIGRAGEDWLLVEAKANHPEFTGSPSRASPASLRLIEQRLNQVKRDFGVHRFFSWTGSYYQYANRLAALWFLRKREVPAQLVFVYFFGDEFPDGTPCPASKAEWKTLFEARRLTLGLPKRHKLSAYEHHVILPALKG